jgi:O-acetyl-ADP-ribose deacetylase (regulator of RNase III)
MSTIKETVTLPGGQTVEVAQGDLTRERVDGIVNAANSNLAHMGGVAAAIARAGGESIQEESDAWVSQYGPVTHAEPAYTQPGRLPCRYVIHAVGPIWGEGEEDRKLEEALRGSLRQAEQLGLRSLAFPAISTGIFGFPKDRAARIFFATFQEYFAENPGSPLEMVRVTLWDDETLDIFLAECQRVLGR